MLDKIDELKTKVSEAIEVFVLIAEKEPLSTVYKHILEKLKSARQVIDSNPKDKLTASMFDLEHVTRMYYEAPFRGKGADKPLGIRGFDTIDAVGDLYYEIFESN